MKIKEISGSMAPKTIIKAKTKMKADPTAMDSWWKTNDPKEVCERLLATAVHLKESSGARYRQAHVFSRLYGNMPMVNNTGTTSMRLDSSQGLPSDRPTFNIVQSACDTLVSRISQRRPTPVFLTDNSDYRERNLAKQLNQFIKGELYQCKAYEKSTIMLRDALVLGDGVIKVYETQDNKVGLERVLPTELLVDATEATYGEPRQLYQIKLVDRGVLMEWVDGKFKKIIEEADKATPENGASGSGKTVSDMVMVVEAWRLPSGKDSGDGRHTIACSSGIILDEKFEKDKFPFVFLHYSPRLLGFWSQGVAEQLMGIQMEINSILYTISKAIRLVGVPRVFVEKGSKVVKAHLNNEVGSIVEYSGTKPSYEVAPAVPQEMYAQLQRLKEYGFEQCGVSTMQATAQKPAGLNSGEAIRSYEDITNDRFAALDRRYTNSFVDLAYLIVDLAKDIANRDGKYQTVYPNKNGTKQIDLPKMTLLEDPFVIQCYDMSALPRDPAGRLEKITEMVQSGMISVQEGRRLLDYPDLEQAEKLANASEERILQILDEIVEDGKYTPPDEFMDLQLAVTLSVQYYNLYAAAKLEEKKADLLREFNTQCHDLVQAAQQPAPAPGAPPGGPMDPGAAPTPQAAPMAPPQSPLIPNAPGAQG